MHLSSIVVEIKSLRQAFEFKTPNMGCLGQSTLRSNAMGIKLLNYCNQMDPKLLELYTFMRLIKNRTEHEPKCRYNSESKIRT